MTLEQALVRLAESRRALHRALEGLSEEQMAGVQVEGVWTIRDVVGHITSWEEVFLVPLRRYAAGVPFEVEVIQDYPWNDEQAARKRNLSLNAILDESAAIRQELVTVAGELSAEQQGRPVPFPWGGKGTVVEGLAGLAEHEMEHVRHINSIS